jgi:hypothetical protein
MAIWNGYIGVWRNVANLNAANFATLIEAMQALGPQSGTVPATLNHDRGNLDDPPTRYNFQASFDSTEVSLDKFKQMMADLFGKPVEDIGDTFVDVSYSGGGRESRVWTFSFPAGITDRVEVVRFGRGGSWAESYQEEAAYREANAADWELPEE